MFVIFSTLFLLNISEMYVLSSQVGYVSSLPLVTNHILSPLVFPLIFVYITDMERVLGNFKAQAE